MTWQKMTAMCFVLVFIAAALFFVKNAIDKEFVRTGKEAKDLVHQAFVDVQFKDGREQRRALYKMGKAYLLNPRAAEEELKWLIYPECYVADALASPEWKVVEPNE